MKSILRQMPSMGVYPKIPATTAAARIRKTELYVPTARLSMVAAVLGLAQLAIHDQAAGGFNIRITVGHGLGRFRGKLAQYPGGQIIFGMGLGTYADAHPGKSSPPRLWMMLFRPLCPPAEPLARMRR